MLECLQQTVSFVGLGFWPFEPSRVRRIAPLLRRRPHALSGYTPACFVAWNRTFDYQWTLCGPQALFISCLMPPRGERHLMQPVGALPPETWTRLVTAARTLPYALQIVGVESAFVESHPELLQWFTVERDRENDNYIYDAAELAELHGHRFAKKRNLITQASRSYSWTAEPLGEANIGECELVMRDLLREEGAPLTESLRQDDKALHEMLAHFAELEQQGVLIRVEGRPAAFSLFEAQGPETAVVHFERALRRHKGLHQIINRAVAHAALGRGFTYINREEDLGDAGLRQAKMSYFPLRLVEAYRLTLRR